MLRLLCVLRFSVFLLWVGSRSQHRKIHPAFPGGLDRDLVACIRVTHDSGPRIGGEHSCQAAISHLRTIGDCDHAGMDRVSDPDAATMMEGDPTRATRGIEHGVKQRPIRDRVAPVPHGLGFPVG